jgi:vacuolar protein sorting-associated protein 53
LTDEIELKACIVINTCEYCLETIPGLHNQIFDKIDESYKSRVDLNVAQDTFRELINLCITAIISSIEAKCE